MQDYKEDRGTTTSRSSYKDQGPGTSRSSYTTTSRRRTEGPAGTTTSSSSYKDRASRPFATSAQAVMSNVARAPPPTAIEVNP